MNDSKLPPQALEAEQSVIGGLMLDNRKWEEVEDEISEMDFYSHNHRLIFRAIAGLQNSDQAADVITVSETLENQGKLEDAGGLVYLGTLANNTPSTANILTYARIVRERSILRSLIAAGTDIIDSSYNPDGRSTREVLDHAEKRVLDISNFEGSSRKGFLTIQELTVQSLNRIEELT